MSLLVPIRQWLGGAIDLIFPPTCVHCGRVGDFLCPVCLEDEFYPSKGSRYPTVEGIDEIIALAVHRGAVRSALHGLKYEHVTQVAEPLGERLADKIQWTFDAVIPVPLHFARLAERGYNQANLLAKALATRMNKPVLADTLIRTKATQSQVTLNGEQRRENMVDAFVVQGEVLPRILLIDDVCTTGSTLGAAAQVLKQAGAEIVYAATISVAQ